MIINLKWNDDWREELKSCDYDAWMRLCECRNTKKDFVLIAKLIYKYNSKDFDKQECFERAVEWICDWNSQYNLLKEGDYDRLFDEYMEGCYV